MKVLLCAATEMEIAPTIQFFPSQQRGTIDVVITGVGLMTSTYALTKSVAIHQPDLIIQAGIAGTLDMEMPLATVVTVKNETIGDLGVQENGQFHSLFDLKLYSTLFLINVSTFCRVAGSMLLFMAMHPRGIARHSFSSHISPRSQILCRPFCW